MSKRIDFSTVEVGDTILAKIAKKTVKGEVTKLHPGSAVIMTAKGLSVIMSDKIVKLFKHNA